MESLKEDYEGHDGKGPDFRFMWIDLDTEREWAELFEFESTPSVVAINPHKKVRFVKLDAGLPVSLDIISLGSACCSTSSVVEIGCRVTLKSILNFGNGQSAS